MFVRVVMVHAQDVQLPKALEYSTGRVVEAAGRLGATFHQVLQGTDDPTLIAHVIGFETQEALDAYWDSPELAALARDGFQVWGDASKLRYAAKLEVIGGRNAPGA